MFQNISLAGTGQIIHGVWFDMNFITNSIK